MKHLPLKLISTLVFFCSALNLSAQIQNQNSPNWWQIETAGEPVDIKILWGPSAQTGSDCQQGFNCEWLGATADYAGDGQRIRIPMTYYAFSGPNSPGAETQYGGCGYSELNSDPNVPVQYYMLNTNTPYTDDTPIVPDFDTMFNVSQPYANAKGLVTYGYTSGTASGVSSALATAFVSSNRCAAGDTEWGFFQNLTSDHTIQFYYSRYTNCGGNSGTGSVCRVYPYQPENGVAQQNGSFVLDVTDVAASTTNTYYSMYIIPIGDTVAANMPPPPPGQSSWQFFGGPAYAFRVQIIDQNYNFATCTATWSQDQGGGNYVQVQQHTGQNCTADFPIDSWFPVNSGGAFADASYLFTGTFLQGGPPNYVGPFWQVNGVWLGF